MLVLELVQGDLAEALKTLDGGLAAAEAELAACLADGDAGQPPAGSTADEQCQQFAARLQTFVVRITLDHGGA